MAEETISLAEEPPASQAQQELLDLINSSNSTDVKIDDVEITALEPANFADRNTKVVIRAKANTSFSGAQEFYYNRLALSQLGYLGIVTNEQLTVEKLLQIISSQKQIALLSEEFEDIVIPVLEAGGIGRAVLRSKAQAIKWHGEAEVDIAFGLPGNLDAFHTFLHVTLPSAGYLL